MTIGFSTRAFRLLALIACLASAACAGRFPYSIPIQQGNVVTVDMLQELKLGMDKRKVTFILGTPLVTDAFHQNRWDYFYSYNPGDGDTVQQRASLYFDENRLVRIDADIQSNIDFHTVTHATDKVVVVPPKKKGGLFAAITPNFVTRDEEQQAQEAIERELDTGFNAQQPGSRDAAAVDPATAALDPAPPAPGSGEPMLPSEIYAPNSPVGFESRVSAPPSATAETVSAETREQSRYLESLFDGFGAATRPAPQREAVSEAEAEVEAEAGAIAPRDPTVPTRD